MLAGNTVWNPWEPDGAFDSLATVTVPSGGLASITFAGIPNTYKHLQIRASVGASGEIQAFVNGDTTATNYYRHVLYGQGSSALSDSSQSYGLYPAFLPSLGSFVQDILDYGNTSKNKTTRSLWGYDANGSGYVGLYSGLWINTNAINSITYSVVGGSNFPQHSRFSLYGIKG